MPTLNWIGKAAVVNHHLEVPYRLLRCDAVDRWFTPGEVDEVLDLTERLSA